MHDRWPSRAFAALLRHASSFRGERSPPTEMHR